MQDMSPPSYLHKSGSTDPLDSLRSPTFQGGRYRIHSVFANCGFTLIEILVVLAIVALLLTLSLPRYFQSIDVAKERVLVENLRTTRDAIDKFYGDTGRYPDSLEELIEKKYLRELPFDPVVESNARWTIIAPSDEIKGNVYDLKSSAEGTTANGKPFAEL